MEEEEVDPRNNSSHADCVVIDITTNNLTYFAVVDLSCLTYSSYYHQDLILATGNEFNT